MRDLSVANRAGAAGNEVFQFEVDLIGPILVGRKCEATIVPNALGENIIAFGFVEAIQQRVSLLAVLILAKPAEGLLSEYASHLPRGLEFLGSQRQGYGLVRVDYQCYCTDCNYGFHVELSLWLLMRAQGHVNWMFGAEYRWAFLQVCYIVMTKIGRFCRCCSWVFS